VLSVGVPAPPGRGKRLRARPFTLALTSGTKVRVEPEEGRWSLDTTFVPVLKGGRTVYSAKVMPGDVIYVRGALHRDTDPRAAGTGYRDAARAWVMRGDLTFSSATVIAAHAARASFHASWAMGLGAVGAAYHFLLWLVSGPTAGLTAGPGLLALLAVAGVAMAYWRRAEATTPWLPRKVQVR
jgi:hypothetical protein